MLVPWPAHVAWGEGSLRLAPGIAVSWSAWSGPGCAPASEPVPANAGSETIPANAAAIDKAPADAAPGDGARDESVRRIAHDLARTLGERIGFVIPVRDDGVIRLVLETGDSGEAGAVEAGITAAGAKPPERDESRGLPAIESEAYRLDVTPSGVRLTATAPIGLFRGMHTLFQLVPDGSAWMGAERDPGLDEAAGAKRGALRGRGRDEERNGEGDGDRDGSADGERTDGGSAGGRPFSCAIPTVRIDDRPRFRWRGLHIDVARHFFPAARVKEAVDWCALHKLNVLHWHLVDDQGWRLPVAGFPRLTEIGAWRRGDGGARYGGAYTDDEIREVVAYATERFVTVVPEIEMPGHARAALAAYPGLSCRGAPLPVPSGWGTFEDVFCAGKEETFAFLGAVLDSVAVLFPGLFVHIGGDECPKARWNTCPDCRRRMEAEKLPDADALQAWFVRRIGRHLAGLGKRLVGWDEILDGAGSVPGSVLPKDAVVMSWRGFDGGIRAARAGHEVVMTPTAHCYFDHYQGPRGSEPPAFPADLPLGRVYAFEPLPPGLDGEAAARILGGQGNTWTEQMRDWGHLQYMVFPRLCALAEALWSPREVRSEGDFRARLEEHARRLDRLGIRHGAIG